MESLYKTHDLKIAAYLYAKGLTLEKYERVDKRVFFYFSPLQEAEKLLQEYYSDNGQVNPRELFSRLSALKDLIFNAQ